MGLVNKFRNWRINSTKDKNKFDINMKNTQVQNKLDNIKNDKNLMNAEIEFKKIQIENEKITSKLELLDTAKNIKINIQLYSLMLISSIITPLGFGLLDHIEFNFSFVSSITGNLGNTILLLFFFTLQIVGFKISSRHNIVDLIYNKDISLSMIALIIFIPLSIVGNFMCFINWLGSGFINFIFLGSCAVLLELFIHHLSRLKFNIENKNYSFKEDNQNEFNLDILSMIKTIISSKIKDKLFDNYLESQQNIVKMNKQLQQENNKGQIENNKDKNKSNIVDFKINKDKKDSLYVDNFVEKNLEDSNNLKALCCDNVEIENNKRIEKVEINKDKNKIDKQEENNNIDKNEINTGITNKISSKDLETLINSYVDNLEIGEQFNDKDLNYLNVGTQRIRRVKDKLKEQNVLKSEGTKGTFKIANIK